MSRPVFRFAPTPNGPLHLGHAYSAGLNQALARATGGRFLLRIEDIDLVRADPGFERAILADLRWLGLSWEEPVRKQSEHLPTYRAALDRLIAMDLAYPATMTRGEVRAHIVDAGPDWPRDPDGSPLYPGVEREMSAAESRSESSSAKANTNWRR